MSKHTQGERQQGRITYTVNVQGNCVRSAQLRGCHAYYANGVTAIEIVADSKSDARWTAKGWGFDVLHVFI